METVKNGRRYNTETAIYYGSSKAKLGKTPVTISLYRKRGGEYFLSTADGEPEYVKHISPRQARVWAYKHLPIDDYEKHFGSHLMEDSSKQSQLLSLKRSTIEKLRLCAAEQNTTMSDIVDQLTDLVVMAKGWGDEDGEEIE